MSFDTSMYAEMYRVAKEQNERARMLREASQDLFKDYCEFFNGWYRKWCRTAEKNGATYGYLTVPEGLLRNLVSWDWVLADGDCLTGWLDEDFDPEFVYFAEMSPDLGEDPAFIKVPVAYFQNPEGWLQARESALQKALDDYLAGVLTRKAEEEAQREAARREKERAEWERLNAIYGKVEK